MSWISRNIIMLRLRTWSAPVGNWQQFLVGTIASWHSCRLLFVCSSLVSWHIVMPATDLSCHFYDPEHLAIVLMPWKTSSWKCIARNGPGATFDTFTTVNGTEVDSLWSENPLLHSRLRRSSKPYQHLDGCCRFTHVMCGKGPNHWRQPSPQHLELSSKLTLQRRSWRSCREISKVPRAGWQTLATNMVLLSSVLSPLLSPTKLWKRWLMELSPATGQQM